MAINSVDVNEGGNKDDEDGNVFGVKDFVVSVASVDIVTAVLVVSVAVVLLYVAIVCNMVATEVAVDADTASALDEIVDIDSDIVSVIPIKTKK